jgi:hypothetical protein
VAVVDSGPKKSAEVKTMATLKAPRKSKASIRSIAMSHPDNAPPDFVANDVETAERVHASVNPDGKSYNVDIPSKNVNIACDRNCFVLSSHFRVISWPGARNERSTKSHENDERHEHE